MKQSYIISDDTHTSPLRLLSECLPRTLSTGTPQPNNNPPWMLGEADCDAPGVPVSNSVVQQNLHSDVVCVKLSSSKVKVETHIQPQAKMSHHSRSNCITATAQLHNNIHEPNPTQPNPPQEWRTGQPSIAVFLWLSSCWPEVRPTTELLTDLKKPSDPIILMFWILQCRRDCRATRVSIWWPPKTWKAHGSTGCLFWRSVCEEARQ